MAHIVVVEDEAPLIRLIGWFLVEAGHDVLAESSADSVYENLRSDWTDIVVCNSGMTPDEKRACFKLWRLYRPSVRIIDVSRPHRVREPVQYVGADVHLQMPFFCDDLVEAVASLT